MTCATTSGFPLPGGAGQVAESRHALDPRNLASDLKFQRATAKVAHQAKLLENDHIWAGGWHQKTMYGLSSYGAVAQSTVVGEGQPASSMLV